MSDQESILKSGFSPPTQWTNSMSVSCQSRSLIWPTRSFNLGIEKNSYLLETIDQICDISLTAWTKRRVSSIVLTKYRISTVTHLALPANSLIRHRKSP
jgi:hypothetical protein